MNSLGPSFHLSQRSLFPFLPIVDGARNEAKIYPPPFYLEPSGIIEADVTGLQLNNICPVAEISSIQEVLNAEFILRRSVLDPFFQRLIPFDLISYLGASLRASSDLSYPNFIFSLK